MFKIKTAGLIMEYSSDNSAFWEPLLAPYLYDGDGCDLSLTYTNVDTVEIPPHTVKGTVKNITYGELPDGRTISYVKAKSGRIISRHIHNCNYTENEITAIRTYGRGTLSDTEREYLKSGIVFNSRLICTGGTVLHGSAISYKGEGIVFSAPCGTGKSTHTRLWKDLYGDDVVYVNDDKPALIPSGNGYLAAGIPWSGKNYLNNNISVPLKAVVFLGRAETPSVRRLGTAESFCYLCDQTFPSHYDIALCDKNIKILENLIKTVPMYKLDCNISDDAVRLVKNTIFQENII